MPAPVTIYGIIADAIASLGRSADNTDPNSGGKPIRLTGRQEAYMANLFNGMEGYVNEGSLWIAGTPTPGTGITLSVATGVTFSDTQALVCLNNTDVAAPNAGGRTIQPLFVEIICTTAPVATTTHFVAHRVDNQPRGSAGTQLGANPTGTSPRPTNMNYGGSPAGQAFALGGSAVSVAASANVRNVGRNVLRSAAAPAWVVGDHVTILFGGREMAAGGVNIGATTASAITIFAPGCAIGPGHSYVMNEWALLRTGALAGEIFVGWMER
jgi:hypothetical protein